MKRSEKIVIQLAQIFDNNLLSRSAISMLFNEQIDNVCFVLDFENISFVSRSAAQQLELEREKLKEKNTEIHIINANEDIMKMFSLAENKSQIIVKSTITHKTFSSHEEQRNFMMSF